MKNILKGKNILIVDDEPDLREVLRDEFKTLECNVFEAENGEIAFQLVSQKKNIDVIISDIRMPGGNGVELLDRIKSENQELPVVLLISGFSDITAEDAYEKGAEAVLSKPCDLELLVQKVKKSLTPTEERWSQGLASIEAKVSITLTFESFMAGVALSHFNLGRGGMYVFLEKEFPKNNQKVQFCIKFSDNQYSPIEGDGTCRWVRTKMENNVKPGVGIEFDFLTQCSVSNLIELLKHHKRTAYIPKR